MLHHYAVKFFAPVIVVPDLHPDGVLSVSAVSDLLEDIECNFTVAAYSWDSFDAKLETTRPVTVVCKITIETAFHTNL